MKDEQENQQEVKTDFSGISSVDVLPISDIKPYPNNPRDNSKAIDKVAFSIKRYGYINPIIVDANHVVIAGHTRLAALKQLGWKEAKVIVVDLDEQKAKELRIIDNKAAEYAEWTSDLVFELREIIDPSVIAEFFPEIKIDAEFRQMDITQATNEEIEARRNELTNKFNEGLEARRHDEESIVMIRSPYNGEVFQVLRSDLMNNQLVNKERIKNNA